MKNPLDFIKDHITYDKPIALQWHEWAEWEATMRKNKPLAYWLNETVPKFFKGIKTTITNPFATARYWIRCRFFEKYHIIPTGLKPGYHDIDERMLHGMFTMLVDFVEVEKAWMQVIWSDDNRRKFHVPWYSQGFFKIKGWRCKEAGLAYLDWECTLSSPCLDDNERSDSQAETAYEILELYKWWTEVRPNRPDPLDASGWSEHCRKKEESGRSLFDTRYESDQDEQNTRQLLDLTHKIEQQHDYEDLEYLTRLIKIRRSLWT